MPEDPNRERICDGRSSYYAICRGCGQAGGRPPAADTTYYDLRGAERIVPPEDDWRELLLPEMSLSAEPEPERELAIAND